MPNHFLSDPIATSNSFKDGYFYPGDLGLINEKGRLVLAGRRDELLNLGGVKANPESLEEIALTVEGVLEAAAFSIQSSTYRRALICFGHEWGF
jgi:acyl-CoA synthetase (AMP-forming)/AMP-acid ligase II